LFVCLLCCFVALLLCCWLAVLDYCLFSVLLIGCFERFIILILPIDVTLKKVRNGIHANQKLCSIIK